MDGSNFTAFDGKTYAYSPYKDNIKDFYRYGPSFTNTVSVSGGGEKNTYRLSMSNLSNNAIVRNSGLNRKNINFNIDQKVTDKLSVQVLVNYIVQQDKNPPQLSDGPGNPNNGLFLAPNIKESWLNPGYDANGRDVASPRPGRVGTTGDQSARAPSAADATAPHHPPEQRQRGFRPLWR